MKDNEMKRLMRLAKQGLPVVYAESGEEPVVIVPLSVYEAMSELPTIDDFSSKVEEITELPKEEVVRSSDDLDKMVDNIEADAIATEEILHQGIEVPTLFSAPKEQNNLSLREKLSGSSFQPSRPDLQGLERQKDQNLANSQNVSEEPKDVKVNQKQEVFEDQFFLEPID